MQGMASELNMYESQVQEYKYEIERLARELQDVKKKYYTQKRKEQQQRLVSSQSKKLFKNNVLLLAPCIIALWYQPHFIRQVTCWIGHITSSILTYIR